MNTPSDTSFSNPIEERLRAAIDAAPAGILMTDANGRIVLANRQIEALFGYTRAELLGREVDALVPERFRPLHASRRAEFMAAPSVRPMGAGRDLFGLKKGGAEFPVEVGLTPVATGAGLYVLAAVVDISSRKRAEERLRIVVESSPSGMLMIDRAGQIVLVNREIERMFGWPRHELLGQSIEVLVPKRFRAGHPAQRTSYFADPKPRTMGSGRDLFGERKDGTEFPVEIGLNPIATDEGVVILGSVVDISARKRAEEEHRRLEDQLRQAQKIEAIGRLASGIAHDFNNVLMGIIGCGELVKQALPLDHPARPIVDDMCNAAARGASLSRDVLNFSRKKPVDAVPSELNAVVQMAERMLRQVIGEDVVLHVELCPSGGPLLGNTTHLEHVLLNLAVNARDAMLRGGKLSLATRDVEITAPLAVRGRMLQPGKYVALDVIDTGTGMDAVTCEHLFEPFYTTKPVGEGSGLGLYTVFSIVDQLGGGIDVETELGVGTRFTLYFPRLAETRAVAQASAVEPAADGPPRLATILIVEDERLIRATLRQLLTRHGHRVLEAENARTALEKARAFDGQIDLLLSDMVLPDASGADVARTLAAERPTLRVLFMSAYPAEILEQQGRIAVGTKTLEKPFDDQRLALAVQAALRARP